jgi:type II secretory pathway pseudopilin PulG
VEATRRITDDDSVTMRPILPALGRRLRRLRDERGITLVELLTSMAIMLIVISSVAGVFVSGSNAEFDLNKRFRAQNEARTALAQFRRDVHGSCSATVSSTSVVLTTLPFDATSGSCTTAGGAVTLSTWCTTGSSPSFTLRRSPGAAACSTTSVRKAAFLTSAAAFAYVPGSAGSGLLPRITLDLRVDTDPANTLRQYRLTDSMALRNATRA